MKPSLKGRKFIFIEEAASHLNIAFSDLIEWLIECGPQLYAYSEYSSDTQPIDPSYSIRVLETKKPNKIVRFIYTKELRKLRLNLPGTDDQEVSLSDLKLSVKDLLQNRDSIRQIYEPLNEYAEQKRGTKNEKVGLNGRGHHFERDRKLIAAEVKKLLKNPRPEFKKKNGSFHLDKIAEFIENSKESWLGHRFGKRGFGFDTIKAAIRKELQTLKK